MDPIIQKCKEILEKYYGDRFAGLILYGSQARGQAEAGGEGVKGTQAGSLCHFRLKFDS